METSGAQTPATSYRLYLRLLYARYRVRGLIAMGFGAVATVLTFWELAGDWGNLGSWSKVSALLAVIFAVLAATWRSMKSEIEGNYTLGLALAHGYYRNLVLRVLADPLARLVIFRAHSLDELAAPTVQAAKKALGSPTRMVEEVPVPGDDGPRTVTRVDDGTGKSVYLDHPRTLRTLESLLDYRDKEYKIATGNSFTPEHRAQITRKLIDDFYMNLQAMISLDDSKARVVITDSIPSHL